jgi:hypothetical protein
VRLVEPRTAYALIHEQVHFAIAEHAARMLTEGMRAKRRVIRDAAGGRQAAPVAVARR